MSCGQSLVDEPRQQALIEMLEVLYIVPDLREEHSSEPGEELVKDLISFLGLHLYCHSTRNELRDDLAFDTAAAVLCA